MIKLINLTKKFGTFTAVDTVSLTVEPGTIFGFLGPNGAGKTTTIRMMVGLLKPTSGEVIIEGKNIAHEPVEAKKVIGFVPDRSFIYEKLTGREFLEFVGGLYGLSKDECREKIQTLLEVFGLTGWGEELIESYSHGMRQRLVLCSALIHNPRVIIVDEPVVGLDPRGARLVKAVFKDLARRGKTIFVSTHVLEIAEEICDRIAIIQDGRVTVSGTIEELKEIANTSDNRLEALFLRLTGEDDTRDAIAALTLERNE
ncbi:MAG: ABC transporter ATP-binding protein [Deltaproteobacteria bacterium]|nr:ABC transporter ATP-binding protein [Deltaproteobacteria bacterium]